MKKREVELGSHTSHSWMDGLAAELFLNSCFSDTVFVTLFCAAVETASSKVHRLLHTAGVSTPLTFIVLATADALYSLHRLENLVELFFHHSGYKESASD